MDKVPVPRFLRRFANPTRFPVVGEILHVDYCERIDDHALFGKDNKPVKLLSGTRLLIRQTSDYLSEQYGLLIGVVVEFVQGRDGGDNALSLYRPFEDIALSNIYFDFGDPPLWLEFTGHRGEDYL